MTLQQLNALDKIQLEEELTKCCGSHTWVNGMSKHFPFNSESELLKAADEVWQRCEESDWLQAFRHHPKIGDVESLKERFASTAQWAAGEQAGVNQTSDETLLRLSQGNKAYEDKFGFIFIVFATGKSAEEMLQLLEARIGNTREQELRNAANEQNKITKLRLQKLLS
jgi:2-oxo-4-hydroxy-4-carboxy-5-ureidoimidazoline decarboxylase